MTHCGICHFSCPKRDPFALTENGKEADQDDCERAHAEPEDLLLLHELAVVAREATGAEARVAFDVVAVDALAAVLARVVQTLVAVHAALAVVRHALPARAPEHRRLVMRLARGGEKSLPPEKGLSQQFHSIERY